MVKDVVSIKAELCFVTFGYAKSLRKCHIGEESTRAAIGIASDVADLAAGGQRKRARGRPRQRASICSGSDSRVTQSPNGSKPQEVPGGVPLRSDTELIAAYHLRTAWSGIRNLAAFPDAGRPRKTSAVIQGIRDLPAPD